jgi:hypothetical protein
LPPSPPRLPPPPILPTTLPKIETEIVQMSAKEWKKIIGIKEFIFLLYALSTKEYAMEESILITFVFMYIKNTG